MKAPFPEWNVNLNKKQSRQSQAKGISTVLTGLWPQPLHQYSSNTTSNPDFQKKRKIDNTKTGLLLLIFGSLISWIPFASAVSWIVVLLGAVLVIMGREAFGREHARNVISSIIIFAVGVGVYVAAFVVESLLSLYAVLTTPLGSYSSIPDISGTVSIILLIDAAVFGIASVLLTYALQKNSGRALLWLAYVQTIALGTLNTFSITPLINGTGVRPFIFEILPLASLLEIPIAIFYATAFFLARKRIVRGEIPITTTSSNGLNL